MRIPLLLLSAAATAGLCAAADIDAATSPWIINSHIYPGAATSPQAPIADDAESFGTSAESTVGSVHTLLEALETMQSTWFELWVGTWPSAIDWTAAVMNTHVISALMSLSKYLHTSTHLSTTERKFTQDTMNKYFAHSAGFYYAEAIIALRQEAYDDMLWVVLGWLQSIKLIKSHSTSTQWHATQYIPGFAHRARVFYDLAAEGWDTRLCGGGMTWNPSLSPYKNAITNELFISASIAMYLHFPGDENPSPFIAADSRNSGIAIDSARPHDPTYLSSAVGAYAWLKASNMTNDRALYVDGFHISGWSRLNRTGSANKCDDRNEMVYTYNQGVVLSGLHDLWEATANPSYLHDGHDLIEAVIAATGFSRSGDHTPHWSGLGRRGVLEDYCDARGTCNQDGQTFKGIFFQHLTQFCQPLPQEPRVPGKSHGADKKTATLHRNACRTYRAWVQRNAAAAWATRDKKGRIGTWWTLGLRRAEHMKASELPAGAIDYRNRPDVTQVERWTGHPTGRAQGWSRRASEAEDQDGEERAWDPNMRGRGRTVESHGGGMSVIRAAWEFSQL